MTLHPNHHRLWKLNTGLQETWALSFSTLPPDSRTLVSKWNTKLALIWKEDFGPLGNSPVLLLLSPGKTPLKTTVAKFLDTSVCGALDALTPASVHSLWTSPKFLNQFCLTILIRLRFSRLVVHLSAIIETWDKTCPAIVTVIWFKNTNIFNCKCHGQYRCSLYAEYTVCVGHQLLGGAPFQLLHFFNNNNFRSILILTQIRI